MTDGKCNANGVMSRLRVLFSLLYASNLNITASQGEGDPALRRMIVGKPEPAMHMCLSRIRLLLKLHAPPMCDT